MKPLELTMNAFESYAEKQIIDFSALGASGLYLITGETGSGKTTIFDAISFALFGKASGSGRDDYQMMRSDFSDRKAKTYVELKFLCGDKCYDIKRSIKKTGQDVELLLPDGTNLTRRKDIDSKMIEVIGLDREQFAQIVMIAQNDFLRFLQSGTDDRLKILRRIFGTAALKQFQERLKARVKDENDKRSFILHDFERYNVDVYRRNEQFALWESQMKADTDEIAAANKKTMELDKKKQELAAALAVATELNRRFSELAAYGRQLNEHISLADEIEKLYVHTTIGEKALRKVKSYADARIKAAAEYEMAAYGLSTAKTQYSTAKSQLEEAVKALSELPDFEAKQNKCNLVNKEWEISGEKLKKLTALQLSRQEIAKKKTILSGQKLRLNIVLKEIGEFPLTEERQAELDDIRRRLTGESEKLEKLSVLQEDLKILEERQGEFVSAQKEFDSLNRDFIDIDRKYRELEERFLRSQAGILASSLVDGECCPVCGSKNHPKPAAVSVSDLTETKLKKKRDSRDELQLKREQKSSQCGELKVAIGLLNKEFTKNLSLLIPNESEGAAKIILPEAVNKSKKTVDILTSEEAKAGKILKDLKVRKAEAEQIRDEIMPQCTALKSEIETLITRFLRDFSEFQSNPQWDNSGAILREFLSASQIQNQEWATRKVEEEISLKKLKSLWVNSGNCKSDAEKNHAKAKALYEERTANEQRLLAARVHAEEDFGNAMGENNFETEEQYLKALITEDQVNENRKRISDYEKKSDQLARDIMRLERETKGREKPDLETLSSEADSVSIQSKELSELCDAARSRLDQTRTALNELRSRAVDFERVEKAYAAVRQLADTANGKLDFETYAQMAYFERVLRSANLRLKFMSQNRYTLLRREEGGDGRKRSGLEIEVLDSYTGKVRSANSLSGGESFMASLSLALGLSDVVQQSAGGVHLDVMFIDEGFGSLDGDILELAVRTLSEMAGAGRIIGIISHIAELRERIDKQIQVKKTAAGSSIKIIV